MRKHGLVEAGPYVCDLSEAAATAAKLKPVQVLLSLPDGARPHAEALSKALSEACHGARVELWGGSCFGACDIPCGAGDGLFVQMGHLPIPLLELGRHVVFAPMRYTNVDPKAVARGLLKALPLPVKGRVVLATTSQLSHIVPKMVKELSGMGLAAVTAPRKGRSAEEGQVLGCSVGGLAGPGDILVFIGDGGFHPLGMALANRDSKVLAYRHSTGELEDFTAMADRFVRVRFAVAQKASEAKSFGILVSTKPGQARRRLADDVARLLASKGRTSRIVVTSTLVPESLRDWPYDAYVSTLCPRVALDDQSRFHAPVLTPWELSMALGMKTPDQYEFDAMP